MKIECTQREKEVLILSLKNSDTCPFIDGDCNREDDGFDKCIEKKIEWNITEG